MGGVANRWCVSWLGGGGVRREGRLGSEMKDGSDLDST